MKLTADRLRELLTYYPASGEFTWREGRNRSKVAGCVEPSGYRRIGIERRLYQAHHLAWLYEHSEWPNGYLDHINGNYDDNSMANLRPSAGDATKGAVTAALVRKLFAYDPESGALTRIVRTSKSVKLGDVVGCISGTTGYRVASINSRPYAVHRLIWLHVHGEWPPANIDHINGVRSDNRIANLRCASKSENGMNRGAPINNSSGFKGVYWHRAAGKWLAQIVVDGKHHYLGLFDCSIAAHEAYKQASDQLHGNFARAS